MKIMLLGKLPKGDKARKNFADWKERYIEKIGSEIPEVEFLHGDLISDKEGSEEVVGHDLWLVKHADVVVVDASTKIGAGTAQEMVMAKYFKIPLIAILPKDTHHRRSNVVFHKSLVKDWIHPFIDVSSDLVAENIDEAVKWLKSYKKNPKKMKVKDIAVFNEVIGKFEKKFPKILKEYLKLGW